ncbi:cohesin loading factor [Phlyctochytrium arcticum]|nr:cohesin loading factor [Phlyctochytrium arcticum]
MHLPPQSAPLYTTLSVLAETHYQHVLNLIASNSPARLEITTKTYQHFATAVKLLETILTAQVLPPKIEVETRFRLAELLFLHTENLDEADSHLQKATLLIRKTSDAQILEFEFKVKDLQCNLIQADRSGKGAKTVKNLLKQAAASALSQNLPRWYYHFVQRRAELCALEGDVPKCISIIQEGVAEARQQGHVEVQAVLTWSVARYAIITRDAAQISTAVAPLELLFESQKNTTEPAVDSQTGATAVSGPPIISNQSLQLFYNLISILYRLQSGNGKEAIKQLSALHSLVEQPTTQSMEELEAGVVHISLPTPQGTESLEVEILSRHKLHAFVFLVSGVTHKLHDNVKAKNHLLEGLKTVEREIARVSTEISDVRRMIADRDWLIELSFIMMRHLAEICMLRQEYSDAFKYLLKLKNWIESYPTLLQSHSAFLTFDWGIFFQAIGDYQRAHNWFQLAIQEGDIDVRFMAQIQLILMAFGRLYGDPTLVRFPYQPVEGDMLKPPH